MTKDDKLRYLKKVFSKHYVFAGHEEWIPLLDRMDDETFDEMYGLVHDILNAFAALYFTVGRWKLGIKKRQYFIDE